MRLVSTTLAGNHEDLVEDALRSLPFRVERCLLIDTGSTDGTIFRAREVLGNKRLVVRVIPWSGDAASMRNLALQEAQSLGATHALTLDVDERLELDERELAALERSVDVVLVKDASETYAKERIIRLPPPSWHFPAGKWVGPVHEAYVGGASLVTLERSRFIEVPKSKVETRAKMERVASVLETHTRRYPDEPRWHYYLGDAYAATDQAAAAIVEFDACERLRGWNEEAAWACYRAAELLHIAGRNVEAIERCARGLTHHAGVAELAWLAGLIEHRQGHYAQAIAWAHMAIANGVPAGNSVARTGFCNPVGLHEGPFDVLRFALRALGDNEGADRAEGYYNEALQKRLSARRIPNTPQKMSTSPMRSALEAPLK